MTGLQTTKHRSLIVWCEMRENADKKLEDKSLYSAAITREQFLYNKNTVILLDKGLDEDSVISQIVADNAYNYPSDNSLRKMEIVCLKRLYALRDEALIKAIAT